MPKIQHGFGTAAEIIPNVFQPAWPARPDKLQVHSADICQVTHPKQACGSVDGIYSRNAGIPITVVHSDCVPILLARQDGGMVAALHGGWRGIYAGIIEIFGTRLLDAGENLATWVAAIGPAIGPCCYEVAEALSSSFEQRFPHILSDVIAPSFRRLDLAAVANAELQRIGIGQIDKLSMCTHCDADGPLFRFRSYRRGDRGGGQQSGLMISI